MVTVITRTIGPSGRDYASFTLAEADVENIGTSADLVANDEAIVFEADAGTYNEEVVFNSTLTTDATRNVTYKPATGSEHGGDSSAGVIIQSLGTATLTVRDAYTVLDGLHAKGGYAVFTLAGSGGTVCRNLICTSTGNYGIICAPTTSIPVAPTTIENCVISGAAVYSLDLRATTIAGTTVYDVRNCTIIGTKGFRVGVTGVAGSVVEIDALNNLALLGDVWVQSGTVTVTGSNNFGGSAQPLPVAIQGSPYPVTASTAYDPGAGDFALYVGKNGALLDSPNNDVIGGGVGPSVNSDVPTTDILGNPRSGATANPGAFEVPQATATLTRTIGPVGRDYASFTLAEADVTNIGGSADLTFENEAIVFEADAGTYSENVIFNSTLTTDATRQVTYRASASSRHGGVPGAGVKIVGSTPTTYTCVAEDKFLGFSDLEVVSITSSAVHARNGGEGVTVDNCILTAWIYGFITFPTTSVTNATYYIRNCVFRALRSGAIGYDTRGAAGATTSYVVVNCSAFDGNIAFRHAVGADAASTSNLNLVNGFAGNCTYPWIAATAGTVTVTGSNNFGGSLNPFPVAIQGSPYPITPTTSFSTPLGSGDYAVYMGATGALANVTGNDVWQQGVGPSVNSDVPTTDINGVARSGATCNPGAFEADGFVAPTVLTRTIGSGKDYASFTLAEADVTNIGGSADLTFENEAIVFEADAATYSEYVTFSSTLTTDATRNVTYKPAAGSEHGGVPGAGVVINTSSFMVLRDDYMLFDGMEVNGSATQVFNIQLVTGATIRNCIVDAAVQGLIIGSDAVDIAVENCVLSSGNYTINPNASSGTVSVSVRNCTVKDGPSSLAAIRIIQSGTGTISAQFVNCLVLNANQTYVATGTATVTGSNNFGGSVGPFPVALQGSPYPITATTNTSPGAGDWAIYEAATGRLYNIAGNDVWQQGVGPTANADVPATDILGEPRRGSTSNPGAFELGLPLPGPYVKPRHFQVHTAADPHAVSLWRPNLRVTH